MDITTASPARHDAEAAAPSPASPQRRGSTLSVAWARHADEVREAQRLRWRVFADEMGARLAPPPGTPAGLDVDRFDAHCEHLLVRVHGADGTPGPVVGTYRVLTPAGARLAGGLYSDGEFELAPLAALRGDLVELGRSCTDPAWRSGGVIMMLWASLGDFMQRNRLRYMIGCASVPMNDGGHAAAALWRTLRETHLASPEYLVQPRLALPVEDLDDGREASAPPLIKGYLRCGARILGSPAWDPDFGTADLPMMMDLQALPASYRRHFNCA
ncbi:MAG: GNAT family N-acetyltransferase [Burkholderiales bacterium]|nr:GNAT family N-acetyltransferase [Burkholderiales bacterium]